MSTRTRRLGVAALAAAASTAGLLSTAGTATALTPTQQTLGTGLSKVSAGKTVTFSGALTGVGKSPLIGQRVELHRATGSGWKGVQSERTDAEGKVKIARKVSSSAKYRLYFPGSAVMDADASPSRTVTVVSPVGQRIVNQAKAQAGKPYVYGATGPDSFDCSGLTQYVHKKVGISLPRTSSDQRGSLSNVSKSSKKPGDLIFFHDGGSVYHVGVYAGSGKMWHAPQSGDVVRKADIWTSSYSVGRAW